MCVYPCYKTLNLNSVIHHIRMPSGIVPFAHLVSTSNVFWVTDMLKKIGTRRNGNNYLKPPTAWHQFNKLTDFQFNFPTKLKSTQSLSHWYGETSHKNRQKNKNIVCIYLSDDFLWERVVRNLASVFFLHDPCYLLAFQHDVLEALENLLSGVPEHGAVLDALRFPECTWEAPILQPRLLWREKQRRCEKCNQSGLRSVEFSSPCGNVADEARPRPRGELWSEILCDIGYLLSGTIILDLVTLKYTPREAVVLFLSNRRPAVAISVSRMQGPFPQGDDLITLPVRSHCPYIIVAFCHTDLVEWWLHGTWWPWHSYGSRLPLRTTGEHDHKLPLHLVEVWRVYPRKG